MTDNENKRGCSLTTAWIILIFIILAIMCERIDDLEKKINPRPKIEIPR